MATLYKIRRIFSRSVKVRLVILLIAIIIGALLETVTLSVMSPFISLLLDNTIIESNKIIRFVYDLLGFKTNNGFLAFIAFLLGAIYIFRGAYLFILSKVQFRFISRRQIELADRLLTTILNKPYLYHTYRNMADFQRLILTDVSWLMQLIISILSFVSDFFMSFFIVAFLMITSVPMTLCVIGFSLICVFLYFKYFRRKIRVAGEENRTKGVLMNKAVNQALGGIKELKVLRREEYFIRQFKLSGDDFARSNQRFQIYNSIPRLLIEVICFAGAFILIGVFIIMGVNMTNIVPQLGLFVLASFRLLPAISRFTGYVNNILFYRSTVNVIYDSLFAEDEDHSDKAAKTGAEKDAKDGDGVKDGQIGKTKEKDAMFMDNIIIENLTFQYPGSNSIVLEDVSLHIPEKKSTAFIGPTGAGKTTLADIILGIYVPQRGNVYYNGKSIYGDFNEWISRIGYIPQFIYLLDESILENVAFGIPRDEVDEARVWESLKQAQMKDFVESLPNKLDTVIGERGIRLSGGQRQRVGIARSLYTNPAVLIMDEATSSLDNETEKAVMDAIENFQGEKTMIIIAHRLSTIENCDVIYRIEDRKVFREK